MDRCTGCRNITEILLKMALDTIQSITRSILRIEDLDFSYVFHFIHYHLSVSILQQVNFSGNKIRSLKGLEDHDILEMVDLEDNEVSFLNFFP